VEDDALPATDLGNWFDEKLHSAFLLGNRIPHARWGSAPKARIFIQPIAGADGEREVPLTGRELA